MGRTDKLGPLLREKLERTEGDPPVIVRLRSGTATASAVSALSATGLTVTGQNSKTNLVFGDAEPEEIDRLQELDIVEQVEFDAPVEALQDGENFFRQAQILPALNAESATTKRNITEAKSQVNANALNERGVTGQGVTVAVLDTGVDSSHPALEGQVVNKVQLADGNVEDAAGHGTWVASAIAGNGAEVNGEVLEGVAPGSDIINVKVLNDAGTGRISTIIEGASRAGDAGADIINLSLGAPGMCGKDSTICEVFKEISQTDDVIFATAAGNGGPGQNPVLPAGCSATIAVGSVDENGNPSRFSSRGPICDDILYPDIAAPGGSTDEGIIAASPSGTTALKGTSMATPFVAGALALLRSVEPQTTTRSASQVLFATASQPNNPDNNIGHGTMDVMAAVEQLQSPGQPDPRPEEDQQNKFAPAIVAGAATAGIFLIPEDLGNVGGF